jgi:two-component system, NarL family, response regulator LiaR
VKELQTVGEQMLRVVLVDHHPLMLAGIRATLEDAAGFEVVGEATHTEDVLPLVARTLPEVVLLDIQMGGSDGLEMLERIRSQRPDIRVIALSAVDALDQIQVALARGAAGYIVKTINPSDLAPAIRQTVEETVYHVVGTREGSELAIAPAGGLTDRELTIVKAVARGLSNQAIARELWVTEQTVKFHLTNIYRKLNIANRTEAARWAYQHGLADHEFDRRDG